MKVKTCLLCIIFLVVQNDSDNVSVSEGLGNLERRSEQVPDPRDAFYVGFVTQQDFDGFGLIATNCMAK